VWRFAIVLVNIVVDVGTKWNNGARHAIKRVHDVVIISKQKLNSCSNGFEE